MTKPTRSLILLVAIVFHFLVAFLVVVDVCWFSESLPIIVCCLNSTEKQNSKINFTDDANGYCEGAVKLAIITG